VLDGRTEGFLRLHLKKGTDRILGATLVAETAGDMISEITVAMAAGRGLATIGAAIHPYPTHAEVFRKAADAWRARLHERSGRLQVLPAHRLTGSAVITLSETEGCLWVCGGFRDDNNRQFHLTGNQFPHPRSTRIARSTTASPSSRHEVGTPCAS
jgi:hypothetical protein